LGNLQTFQKGTQVKNRGGRKRIEHLEEKGNVLGKECCMRSAWGEKKKKRKKRQR